MQYMHEQYRSRALLKYFTNWKHVVHCIKKPSMNYDKGRGLKHQCIGNRRQKKHLEGYRLWYVCLGKNDLFHWLSFSFPFPFLQNFFWRGGGVHLGSANEKNVCQGQLLLHLQHPLSILTACCKSSSSEDPRSCSLVRRRRRRKRRRKRSSPALTLPLV